MRRRPVPGCLALLLAGLALGAPPAVSPAAAATTLNFLAPKFDEWEAFVTVANRLGKDMGIEVKPEYLPWDDVFQKALIDSKSGVKTWDLVYVYNTWVPGIAASNVLTPITEFLANPANRALVKPEDFIRGTTAGLESQGKLYAMPALAAPYMLGYRKDLFGDAGEQRAFQAKYGYKLGVPQTYRQLMDAAQFFTRKKGEKLAGKPLDEDFYGIILANKSGGFLFHRYEQVLVAHGADLIYDQKTMMPTVNSRESVAAAKYYVELHKYMQPGTETHTGGGAQRVMAADRGAMSIDALDNMLSVLPVAKVSKVVGKVAYALLPTQVESRPHAHVADANGPGIYALSTHKEEAFKLLARVLSTDGTKQLMREYPALVPMRTSVVEDPEVRKNFPQVFEAMSLVIKGKPYTVFVPPLKEWIQAQDIVEAGLSAAMAGQKSPEDAMNEAQAKVVELFKRAGYIK
ncbi:MAG TPA: extracellular solute-binding protein [Methylomirabilota bacterium]|nr:extracellular solute-binding protein [Methylomirabilota bacterium]